MIVITGGAGFIGSCFLWQLNQSNISNITVVDHLGTEDKWQNLAKRHFHTFVHKDKFFDWLAEEKPDINCVIHMGACSTTTESDADYLMANNFEFSVKLFQYCTRFDIPIIYASSAATYGDGSTGYSDQHDNIKKLRPINKYGFSKHLFDAWVLHQIKTPPFWAGLKFFNVYGPQEYHKKDQTSVIYKAYFQVLENQSLKLFKSYKKDFAHGEQKRDFIYVKDAVKIMEHIYHHRSKIKSGIYNIGTGTERTFIDLGNAVFEAVGMKPKFQWIEMPDNIQNQYQYYTQANLEKLKEQVGYTSAFTTLEEGVADYVKNYLLQQDRYL